jgi:hypothetical protein
MEFRVQPLHGIQIKPIQPRAFGELTQQLRDDRRIAEEAMVERVMVRFACAHDSDFILANRLAFW